MYDKYLWIHICDTYRRTKAVHRPCPYLLETSVSKTDVPAGFADHKGDKNTRSNLQGELGGVE
jgi:hypothetical protein